MRSRRATERRSWTPRLQRVGQPSADRGPPTTIRRVKTHDCGTNVSPLPIGRRTCSAERSSRASTASSSCSRPAGGARCFAGVPESPLDKRRKGHAVSGTRRHPLPAIGDASSVAWAGGEALCVGAPQLRDFVAKIRISTECPIPLTSKQPGQLVDLVLSSQARPALRRLTGDP
jgi:hypothetical protein